MRLVRFGLFEVDLRAGEVTRKGVRIKLQGQPYLLLIALLKERGELVSRDDLRRTLWQEDTFIDFDHSLGTGINKLREVLGDSATNPRFIETLPRRGYRFIAPVELVEMSAEAPVVEETAALKPALESSVVTPPRRRISSTAISFGAALLVAILLVGIWYARSRPSVVIRSLVVLPLQNLSGDPSQDYFSDGMTDELITELGQIGELRVISRTSAMTYKGAAKLLPQIAQELNVDAVVEGTVLRSGHQVRITAQLIQASNDTHLWAQTYEGDLRETLALQHKVARSIAQQIRVKLKPQAPSELRPVDPEAHEAYLKGRYFWNKRTGEGLVMAVDYFNQAIGKVPDYAQAYSGLADSYALMGDWEYGVLAPKEAFSKALQAATKALALDNALGEAHTSLGFSLDLFDWDWPAAEREFKQAIELSPSYATAHQWYAWHLIVLGRKAEALAEMRVAQSVDPLSLIISADMADLLLISRSYDEAAKQIHKTLQMDQRFAVAHYQLGQVLLQKHQYAEAIAEIQRASELSAGNITFTSNLAYAYAVSGKKAEALALLSDLQKRSSNGFANPSGIALIYVGLGDKDQAMAWLEKAYEERFNPSLLFRPCFDPLRTDPRFQDLLRRMGLTH